MLYLYLVYNFLPMKYYTLCILIFICSLCSAQNYNVVQLHACHFFGYENGIRIDSVDVSGSDSIFYNYTVADLNPDSIGCVNFLGPSWIGKKIIKRSDSLTIIINHNNDSLFIHPLDPVGSTWLFYPGITANVTSIAATIINGALDSIKTFSLSNSSKIILSRNHGFYQALSFLNYPGDTTAYYLNDQLEFTDINLYNFDVGDTFQMDRYIIPGNSPFGYVPSHHFDIKIVTSKNVSANGDTISYTYLTQSLDTQVVHDSTGTHVISTYSNSTYSDQYILPGNSMLFGMPNESFAMGAPGNNYYSDPGCNPNDELIRTVTGYYYFDTLLNCFTSGFEPVITEEGYRKGFGLVFYNTIGCNACGDMSVYYQMAAYHKANCQSGYINFFNSIDETNSNSHFVKVYPNPVQSPSIIYVEKNTSALAVFELIDVSGKIILTNELKGFYTELDLHNIANGFYFYRVLFADDRILTGKIIR
jgi:hypothetical protein